MPSMNDMSCRSNEESLCEKSMQVVINIIKLSSLQTPSLFSGAKNITSKRVSDAEANRSPSPPVTADAGRLPKKNLKSQKVQKPAGVSYLIEPAVEEKDNNKTAVYVIHNNNNNNHEPEKKNVDGMASDYIKSVREKFHLKSNDNGPRFPAFMKKSRRRPLLA